jgi:hypothetical protein
MKNKDVIKLILNLVNDLDNDSTLQSKNSNEKLEIGKQYFIKTVTYHYVGILKDIFMIESVPFMELSSAMWVADSGRLSNALKEGLENQSEAELEPYPDSVNINISTITEITEYKPKIILIQK